VIRFTNGLTRNTRRPGAGDEALQAGTDQVNRENVNKLRLAWVLTMHDGSNQATPLVHDGIMYLTHPQNVIQALDAATGDLIWEYTNEYAPSVRIVVPSHKEDSNNLRGRMRGN